LQVGLLVDNHTQQLKHHYQIKLKIMTNYKSDYYNPETFEKTEIETKIPIDLVNKICRSIENIEGYLSTPSLVNPDNKDSVIFGIMDMNDRSMKYKITISPNNTPPSSN
jgi:hypothetical protein